MCVRRALIGRSSYGATPAVRRHATGDAFASPGCRFLRYTDATEVQVLAEAAAPVAAAPLVETPTREDTVGGAVNELLPGSGVFCEHCDAEVHPDCEVCPACGRDISAWVDDEEEGA